jgi:hypothetical protein
VVLTAWSGPASGQPAPAERSTTGPAVPDAVPPPFWVAGVAISAERRSAVLVPLDEARREVGVITLQEGESYNGHRVLTVEPDRVVLERDGRVFALAVGRPYSGPRGAGDGVRPRTGPIFVPGPDKPKPDVEYTGPQVTRGQGAGPSGGSGDPAPSAEALQSFVERLFGHPQMQQQIEEIRPIIRQKMDRARQDGR